MVNEELRQKYLEFQMAVEQMRQMHAHLQAVEAKRSELELNISSLEDIKGRKSAEMLAPIVEGVFLRAELKSDSEVVVNVGAGVCVNKKIEEAVAILREKQAELGRYAKELAAEIETASEGIKELEEELNRIIKSG